MKEYHIFKQFAKKKNKKRLRSDSKAVIYTRVSTKEQAENNASLETQKKYCEAYAKRKGYDIVAYFGGTYESAKSDERKEFQRMLTYVKRKKDVSYIIVYSYDRFSRTGANGAMISDQLKKQGIATVSATQEVDTNTSAGTFQQNLYYMFSQFDNELRRDKSVTGMREKLRKGHWIGLVPLGYTNMNPGSGKTPNFIINDDGKILQEAFRLKKQDQLTNVEIAKVLKKKGLNIVAGKLSKVFRNPFYCGLILSSHLPDEVIEGKHPAMITKKDFLQINKIISKDRTYGIKRKKEDVHLPLKQFMRSAATGASYTGYKAKSVGIYYYKTTATSSKSENRKASVLHEKFIEELSKYQLKEECYIAPLKELITTAVLKQNAEDIEQAKESEIKIKALEKKIARLEERYVFEEITKKQYDTFKEKLREEIRELEEDTENAPIQMSKLEKSIELGLKLALNIKEIWKLGDITIKKTIQHLVFPDGILYDRENDSYRIPKVNTIFSLIPLLPNGNETTNTGSKSPSIGLYRSVVIELAEMTIICM